MLAIQARRRICIANISAGAIAGPASAVIPTPRVLGNIAADRPLVANLRGGGGLGSVRQDAVFLAHHRVAYHFCEGGHRANFQPIANCANAAQLFDLAQVDNNFGPLDAILKPVEAV